MRIPRLAWFAVVLSACASQADRLSKDGLEALGQCDIRTAHTKFTAAYDDDDGNANAALGFALTDLALLPEAPEVTAALAHLGFSGALDVHALVFGPEGLLARSARGDTCESIGDFTRANIPYAPLAIDGPAAWEVVRSGATLGDVLDDLRPLAPRLARIARALETAAAGHAEPVSVEGGCGLGTVVLQGPELYLLAALVELARFTLVASDGYDNEMSLALLLDDLDETDSATVDTLNAHFLHLDDAAKVRAGKDILRRSLGFVRQFAVSVRGTAAAPNGLFDWSLFPDLMADDLLRLADSVIASLDAPTAIADITPPVTLDVSKFFSTPLDAAALSEPFFTLIAITVEGAPTVYSVEMNGLAWEEAGNLYVTPSPWDTASWGPSDRWNAYDADPLIDPARRYEGVYSCMDAP